MMIKRTTKKELFLEKLKKREDKGKYYNYSKVDYIHSNTNITIICPIHGDFKQKPYKHLIGHGCNKCGIIKRSKSQTLTTNEFLKKLEQREDKGKYYDYSKVKYINRKTNIIIICPIHGEFKQTPTNHQSGHGCNKCAIIKNPACQSLTTDDFLERLNKREDKGKYYNYNKVNYINSDTDIIIICSKHGEFKQRPFHHLNGHGCSKCGIITNTQSRSLTTEEFLERVKQREDKGKYYDYSKVNYINNHTPVIIICPEHGEFEQIPYTHISNTGCSKCNSSGYSKVSISWLHFMEIQYNTKIQHQLNFGEYKIPDTRYKADGYSQEINTIFEFHGDFWHGNPIYYNSKNINPISKKTFGELYTNTIIKENIIKQKGYNLVIIWENDWKHFINIIKKFQRNFRNKHK